MLFSYLHEMQKKLPRKRKRTASIFGEVYILGSSAFSEPLFAIFLVFFAEGVAMLKSTRK